MCPRAEHRSQSRPKGICWAPGIRSESLLLPPAARRAQQGSAPAPEIILPPCKCSSSSDAKHPNEAVFFPQGKELKKNPHQFTRQKRAEGLFLSAIPTPRSTPVSFTEYLAVLSQHHLLSLAGANINKGPGNSERGLNPPSRRSLGAGAGAVGNQKRSAAGQDARLRAGIQPALQVWH